MKHRNDHIACDEQHPKKLAKVQNDFFEGQSTSINGGTEQLLNILTVDKIVESEGSRGSKSKEGCEEASTTTTKCVEGPVAIVYIDEISHKLLADSHRSSDILPTYAFLRELFTNNRSLSSHSYKIKGLFYQLQRIRGKLPVLFSAHGFWEADLRKLDDLPRSESFGDPLISRKVAFYYQKLGIVKGARFLSIDDSEFVCHCLDFFWRKKGNSHKYFDFSKMLCHYSIDLQCIKKFTSFIFSETETKISDLLSRMSCDPKVVMIMLTLLYGVCKMWSISRLEHRSIATPERHQIPPSGSNINLSTAKNFIYSCYDKSQKLRQCAIEAWNPSNTHVQYMQTLIEAHCFSEYLSQTRLELVDTLSSRICNFGVVRIYGETIPSANTTTLLPPTQDMEMTEHSNLRINSERVNESSVDTPLRPHDKRHNDHGTSTVSPPRSLKKTVRGSGRVVPTINHESSEHYLCKLSPTSFCLARQCDAQNFTEGQVVNCHADGSCDIVFSYGTVEVVKPPDLALISYGIDIQPWEGVRVCALYDPKYPQNKNRISKAYYSGIVGRGPHGNEMLVFFDNGFDALVPMQFVFPLAEQKWNTNEKDKVQKIARLSNWMLVPEPRKLFMKHYLKSFPDWKLVQVERRMNVQRIHVKRDDRSWSALVLKVFRVFVLLRFPQPGVRGHSCTVLRCDRHEHVDELIYRGSARFPTIEDRISKLEMCEKKMEELRDRNYMDSKSDPSSVTRTTDPKTIGGSWNYLQTFEIPDWSHFWTFSHGHNCSPNCIGNLEIVDCESFESCSPYMIPLYVGWTRQALQTSHGVISEYSDSKVSILVVYVTPCGIGIYNLAHIFKYLKMTESNLTVDLFTFDENIRPNFYFDPPPQTRISFDYSEGCESIRIPVYNEIDSSKPERIPYATTRFPFNPHADVSSISPCFRSCCSCEDDCSDPERCECQLLTKMEALRLAKSLQPSNPCGYSNRRILLKSGEASFLSGIYECNDSCFCSKKHCLNRVVQQNIKVPLQLFKTQKSGWGLRVAVDVPAGVFLCTYVGAILTDNQAESMGNEQGGDEYFADINLVESVEAAKRNAGIDLNDGYFSDDGNRRSESSRVSEADETDFSPTDSGQDSSSSSEYEDAATRANYPTRSKIVPVMSQENVHQNLHKYATKPLFTPAKVHEDQNHPNSNESSTQEADLHRETGFNVVNYLESCEKPFLFLIDAKRIGNIGRFFNHSCCPNVITHQVFVDTHDLRLPWIAFFTLRRVSAGTELCWDYDYSIDTSGRKHMECYCGSKKCRKRLL